MRGWAAVGQGRGVQRIWSGLAVALLAISCGQPLATPVPVFVAVDGSMDMVELVNALSSRYESTVENVRFEVEGHGSSYGLSALQRGQADVAMVAGSAGEWEDGLQTTAIARDGIAVVVHPNNGLDGVGLIQLQALFSGRAYEWLAVGGSATLGSVQPISREEGSGARAAFESLSMGDEGVTPRAMLLTSPQAVVDYVAAHPSAIGYVSMAQVTPAVKVLKVEGVLPTPETVGQGTYPLTRELFLVAREPMRAEVQSWIEYCGSPAGQQVVGQSFGRLR